jgi:uncharacterized DUF497 family protein
MKFEWDEDKNQINISKHDIDLETAVQCWDDPNNFDTFDEKHSSLDEKRWLKFGRLKDGKIICVVYTDIPGDRCRIISAFSDKRIERFYYEQDS